MADWNNLSARAAFQKASKAHPKLNLAMAGLGVAGAIAGIVSIGTLGLPLAIGMIAVNGLSTITNTHRAYEGFRAKERAQELAWLGNLELAESVQRLTTDLKDTKKILSETQQTLENLQENKKSTRTAPATRPTDSTLRL